jgi:leucyl-tRNA synthetase
MDEVAVVVQINGKLRGNFSATPGATLKELEERALALDKIAPYLAGKSVKKVIVIPGKLVNIVVV